MAHRKIPKKPPPKDRPETLDEIADRLFDDPYRPFTCIKEGKRVKPGRKYKIY